MATQYETGHAKNVANLQKLIEQITTYTEYNPPIENLKQVELSTLYQTAIATLNSIKTKTNANKEAIYIRQKLQTELKPKATRIINHLDILGLKEGTFAQAKSINKLIQGTKKTIKVVPESEEQNENENKKTKSTSRQSFTETAENLSKLLQLVATIENYNPNIEDLKIENLNTYQTNLVNATQQVNQTEAELNTELMERNIILYNDENGLFETAQNVKKYVKSVYGATSPEYAKVTIIKFNNLK